MGRYFGVINRTKKTNLSGPWKGAPPSEEEMNFIFKTLGWECSDEIISACYCECYLWVNNKWVDDNYHDESSDIISSKPPIEPTLKQKKKRNINVMFDSDDDTPKSVKCSESKSDNEMPNAKYINKSFDYYIEQFSPEKMEIVQELLKNVEIDSCVIDTSKDKKHKKISKDTVDSIKDKQYPPKLGGMTYEEFERIQKNGRVNSGTLSYVKDENGNEWEVETIITKTKVRGESIERCTKEKYTYKITDDFCPVFFCN